MMEETKSIDINQTKEIMLGSIICRIKKNKEDIMDIDQHRSEVLEDIRRKT